VSAQGSQNSCRGYQGYLWATASIVLVSLAQLMMKWGVGQLPPLPEAGFSALLESLRPHGMPLLCIAAGVLCYALSLLCWIFTLNFLPLNRAYSLLSLSYALVALAAAVLPWFGESMTLLKIMGILLILSGVRLIHAAPEKREN